MLRHFPSPLAAGPAGSVANGLSYIPPFCIKGMEQEVNPEHHIPSTLRAAGWHITAVTLSIQTGEQAMQ